MRFVTLHAWEQYLHLGDLPRPAYGVQSPVLQDRKRILHKTLRWIQDKVSSVVVSRCDPVHDSCELFTSRVLSRDLFGSVSVVIVEEADKLREQEAALIARTIEHPQKELVFLFGFAKEKLPTVLADLLHRVGVILDLSQETAEGRVSRLIEEGKKHAVSLGKGIDAQAVALLVHSTDRDWGMLLTEIEKLANYVDDDRAIGVADVQQLSMCTATCDYWWIAEEIVWHDPPWPQGHSLDLAAMHLLIGQIRYYLRLGLQLCAAHEESRRLSYQMRKFGALAQKRGAAFFTRGLLLLLDTETKGKTAVISPKILLDRFIGELHRPW